MGLARILRDVVFPLLGTLSSCLHLGTLGFLGGFRVYRKLGFTNWVAENEKKKGTIFALHCNVDYFSVSDD